MLWGFFGVLFIFVFCMFLAYRMLRHDTDNLLLHFQIQCQLCGNDGVTEREQGSYQCPSCGYDRDISYQDPTATLVKKVEHVSIAVAVLEGAAYEFGASRQRSYTVTVDNRQETRNEGPFPERFLEGLEQVYEAISTVGKLDLQPQPPTKLFQDKIGEAANLEFNEKADRAITLTNRFRADLIESRDRLREEFVRLNPLS